MNPLLRAACAGAASGCRTFTGLSMLALTTPATASTQPDKTLRRNWARGGIALFGAQELVMDKLPQTPSRLEPLGLGMRATAAAASGTVVARRSPEFAEQPPPGSPVVRPPQPSTNDVIACVAVSVAAALGASYLGEKARGLLADRVGTDYVGAGLEDVIGVGLGWLATRTPARVASHR